jgi:hypothetical protein
MTSAGATFGLGFLVFALGCGCASSATPLPADAGDDDAPLGSKECSCPTCSGGTERVPWPADRSCGLGACDGISNFVCDAGRDTSLNEPSDAAGD